MKWQLVVFTFQLVYKLNKRDASCKLVRCSEAIVWRQPCKLIPPASSSYLKLITSWPPKTDAIVGSTWYLTLASVLPKMSNCYLPCIYSFRNKKWLIVFRTTWILYFDENRQSSDPYSFVFTSKYSLGSTLLVNYSKGVHDPLSIIVRIYSISSNKPTDPQGDMSNPSNKPVNHQS